MKSEKSRISQCADLVSLRNFEPILKLLLQECPPGKWAKVATLFERAKLIVDGAISQLFVTWLPDTNENLAYVVIIFYDRESYETFGAHYNKDRLSSSAVAAGGTACPHPCPPQVF